MRRLLFAIFILSLSPTFAFELTPISMTLQAVGEESSGVVNLKNPHDSPKAIQISITTRQPDEFGVENNEDAEEHFLVYPPQILLMPQSSQAVRISWIGEPKLESEKAFRFVAEELNVELDEEVARGEKKSSNIRLLMKYEGALYISPSEKAAPQLKLTQLGSTAQDPSALSFSFENTGNIHQVLYDLTLTMKQGDKQFFYPTEKLKGISGMNILAHSKRTFSLEKPEGFANDEAYTLDFAIALQEESD